MSFNQEAVMEGRQMGKEGQLGPNKHSWNPEKVGHGIVEARQVERQKWGKLSN